MNQTIEGSGESDGGPRCPHGSETAEREAAVLRGKERRMGSPDGARATGSRKHISQRNPAFVALADNVRDYAIFLLDPDGVITYWGEGAHLLKWWLVEEAEGAHLRLLYPENGAEDGTAEAHLRQAAESGEYVGEGQRIRRDLSTFWAGVTLTSLRDGSGNLLGFAKVTRDLSARRAVESALAATNLAQSDRAAALELARRSEDARRRAEETAEFEREHARATREYMTRVLEPELEAERARRREEPPER